MPSFTTIYRVIVMIAVGVIVVKGWQHYGPSAEQAKLIASRAVELAQNALNGSPQPAGGTAGLSADPRGPAPRYSAPLSVPPSAEVTATGPDIANTSPGSASAVAPPLAAIEDGRLPALFSRLEALGVADPQLGSWGNSGQLYRFCCRAPLADMPTFTRHFESVAAEPVLAVEQVVAKVEAWRMAQQGGGALR